MARTLEVQWKVRRKLRAEGSKLRAEGDKLQAEGDIGWCSAVIEAFGHVVISWEGSACVLPNGECYDA